MFIACVSGITEPPFNDIWTVPGEEHLRESWNVREAELFAGPDSVYDFFSRQLTDFLRAIQNDTEPLVTLEDGRKTVELFTAIYRSTRDRKPVTFPLDSEE